MRDVTARAAPPHLRNRVGARRWAVRAMLACALLAPAGARAADMAVPEVRFTVTAFRVTGDNPLGEAAALEALAPHLGEHRGLAGLQVAARALEAHLADAGHVFHRVVIPPQRSPGGEIELRVVPFTLGLIEVLGNEHFSRENVLASLPSLRPGAVPDARAVNRALQIANENAFKQARVTLREGEAPDTLDAVVEVADRRPWRAVLSLNNRGTPEPSRTRASVALHHGNLFDRDHEVVLSFLTSPGHLDDVRLLAGTYRVPLYRFGGHVEATYVHADTDVGTVADVLDVASRGRFALLRYTQALRKLGRYSHRVSASVEDKLFDADVTFLGVPLGADVRSRPLTLRYAGEWRWPLTTASLSVEWARNLQGGGHGDDADYAASRFGADARWWALRYGAGLTHYLADGWRLQASFSGQQAREPLISGEQFGVGGGASVRGLDERVLTGDGGQQLALTLWTPPLWRELRFAAFLDQGRVVRENPQPAERAREDVASAGVGIGFDWERASLRAMLGYVLDGASVARRGDHLAHFSFVVQF